VRLADASIRRPVFAVMLVGALVVFGLVSIPRLGVDLMPRVEFPMVTVTTVLQGASPETVERELTQPLEQAVNTIEGIRTLRSTSSDSLSQLVIEFELSYDVRQKAQDVRDKVAAARGDLPAEADPPVIDRVDPDASPILSIMLAGPQSIRTLSELADKKIKPRLERVQGVGSVSLVGDRAREIRIWVDPVRLSGYALAVDDVLAALKREHVEMPGGRIETEHQEYTVKTKGKLTSVEAFANVIVADLDGRVVHLRDVASVEDGMAEERTIARLNGERGVSLQIRRQSGENTVSVAKGVRRELARVRETLPAGVQMIEAQDTSRFIQSSVDDVGIDILWGGFLAVAVVLAFLRSGRSTLIAAIAIPSSLLASFGFFYFFGFTLNVMTLMALSLSIGMLIDDAIVVIENIYRHIEGGEEPKAAASSATQEIGLAVVATTLSICAVFVPIAFMRGMVGQFFREFGLVVVCAVMASLLVALTTTPMLCSRYLNVKREHGRVWLLLERAYEGLELRYRRALRFGLEHRGLVVALLLGAVVAGGIVAKLVPVEFAVPADRSEFNVWLKLPLGSPIQQTLAVTAAVETALHSHPEVQAVFSTIGGGVEKRVNEANLYVQLTPKAKRRQGQTEIMEELRRRIGGLGLPLKDYAVEEIQWFGVSGMRFADVMYSLRGPNTDRLNFFAHGLLSKMREAGGYVDLSSTYETGKPEIALDLNRERAGDLGVPAAQIGSTISALLAGFKVTSFEEGGERYDVRLQVLPEYRNDPQKLGLIQVRAPSGALVPLGNLVNPRVGSGPVEINREDRTRSITVLANLSGKSLGEAAPEMMGFGRELGVHGEYQLVPVGTAENMAETIAAIGFAFLLALTALYMILASQFNSFIHPFTIMLSAPLSFVGAFAAMALLGFHLDMMGQIGLLMLMGLVMKNGILLVDYSNTLRQRGASARSAVLEAGPARLRPVLMTTTAMVFGMLPVAFGKGDGSEWRAPMGIISIGGMASSTLLTLLVVPVVYTLVDDAEQWAESRLRGVRARLTGTPRTVSDQR
jgi:hydrophobic/amphiphilic exporter-1 (mainly G- bacteria), HAE1 family